MLYPKETWEWYGLAGHFICGRWCRFHLCTKVGPWIVSTVGQYIHPRHGRGSEQAEAEWQKQNPNGEEIGAGRFYETMVFRAGGVCNSEGCGCGQPMPEDWGGLDMSGYQTVGEAAAGHHAMCEKWATVGEEEAELAVIDT